jgi:predicted transposase YbfD/YdcC
MRNLIDHLSLIPEFRRENRNLKHKLLDILMISICSVFYGMEDFEEIAFFGEEKEDFLRTFLSLENGIPSHDTFRRVFQLLDSKVFNEKFRDWVSESIGHLGLKYELVNLDGKTLCGAKSGLHLESAFAGELGLSLAQLQVETKENEITAIPNLLEMLHLEGCIVTIDAMGTQKDIAEKIIEKGGDYFLALKGNQAELLEQVGLEFKLEKPCDTHKEVLIGAKNEVISYETTVSHLLKWIENKGQWVALESVVKVVSKSEGRGESTRYYISSVKGIKAKKAFEISRGHWAIENKLHWQLDVLLREDSKRNRKDNSATNLAILRKILLNAAYLAEDKKLSKKKILKKMILNQEYLLKMLFLII